MRHLHPAEYTPGSVREVDKDFTREIDFQNTKCSVGYRDIDKVKKRIVLILMFLVMKTRKNIQSMC